MKGTALSISARLLIAAALLPAAIPAFAQECITKSITGGQGWRAIEQLRNPEFREFAALAQIDLSALERFSGDHPPTDEEVRQLLRPGGPLSYRRVLRFRRLIVDQWQAREGRVRSLSETLALARTFPIFNAMDDVPPCRRERISFASRAPREEGAGTGETHSTAVTRPAVPAAVEAKPDAPPSASDVCRLTNGQHLREGSLRLASATALGSLRNLRRSIEGANERLLNRTHISGSPVFLREPNSDQPFAHLRDIHGIQIEALRSNRRAFLATRDKYRALQRSVSAYACSAVDGSPTQHPSERDRRICLSALINGRQPQAEHTFHRLEGDDEVPSSVVSASAAGHPERAVRKGELPLLYRSWVTQVAYMDTMVRMDHLDTVTNQLDETDGHFSSNSMTRGEYEGALNTLNTLQNSTCAGARTSGSYAASYRTPAGAFDPLVAEQATNCREAVGQLITKLREAYNSSSCVGGAAAEASEGEGASAQ